MFKITKKCIVCNEKFDNWVRRNFSTKKTCDNCMRERRKEHQKIIYERNTKR